MRKLLLASFSFKTGEIRFDEHRLVVVDFHVKAENMPSIVDHFKKWFESAYPESEWLGGTVYPSLEITGLVKQVKAPAPEYGVYSAHPLNELPEVYNEGMSRQMVIDMDGNRKNFQLSHYDFDQNEWVFAEDDTSLLERDYAMWMDVLPFADR